MKHWLADYDSVVRTQRLCSALLLWLLCYLTGGGGGGDQDLWAKLIFIAPTIIIKVYKNVMFAIVTKEGGKNTTHVFPYHIHTC